jgi:hypothetical protein
MLDFYKPVTMEIHSAEHRLSCTEVVPPEPGKEDYFGAFPNPQGAKDFRAGMNHGVRGRARPW